MKYLRKFNSQEEYETYRRRSESLLENSVSLAGPKVNYYNTQSPFYIEAIEDITLKNTSPNYGILYSFGDDVWTSLGRGYTLEVSAGTRLYLRPGGTSSTYSFSVVKGTYNVGGSLNPSDWKSGLFQGETNLISAENLILEGNGSLCLYDSLFSGCFNLVKAPKAIYRPTQYTNAGGNSYPTKLSIYHMFYGCTSLEEAPAILLDLAASTTTSTTFRLDSAFEGCSKLSRIDILTKINVSYIDRAGFLKGVADIGVATLNYHAAPTFLTLILPSIPAGWDIRYYDSTTDKYFIKFTIDGKEYLAEEGMTWGEWVSSKYNTIEAKIQYSTLSYQKVVYCPSGYILSEGTNVLDVQFIKATRGEYTLSDTVRVQHIDGSIYTIDNWISEGFGNDLANGVVVTSNPPDRGIVVAKWDVLGTGNLVWGPTDVDIATSVEFGTGEANTDLIINTLGDSITVDGKVYSNYAAKAAKEYKFPNGSSGFLPSRGEASLIADNLAVINDVLSKVGGSGVRNTSHNVWTSSQHDISKSYAISGISNINSNGKSALINARPIILLEYNSTEPETTQE